MSTNLIILALSLLVVCLSIALSLITLYNNRKSSMEWLHFHPLSVTDSIETIIHHYKVTKNTRFIKRWCGPYFEHNYSIGGLVKEKLSERIDKMYSDDYHSLCGLFMVENTNLVLAKELCSEFKNDLIANRKMRGLLQVKLSKLKLADELEIVTDEPNPTTLWWVNYFDLLDKSKYETW